LVLDADRIEDRPVVHNSVPQGHHLHALLQGGLRVASSLYPSLTQHLRQLGAITITMGRDAVWYLPDGKATSLPGRREDHMIPIWRVIAPVVASLNLSFAD
jgi:hypothetical protein